MELCSVFDELVGSLPQYFATPETRIACPEERKFQVPELLKSEFATRYRIIDIDGIRVEFGDGWGLVRASNTQPVLVVRFEARTEARLEEIRDTMMTALRKLGVAATNRASFYVYTIPDEIDRLVDGLHKVKKAFG